MKRFLSVLALVMALGPPALSAQVVTDTVRVTVEGDLAAVAITSFEASFKIGDSVQFVAEAVDSEGDPVSAVFTWASGDTTVVRIDPATGLAVGVGKGTNVAIWVRAEAVEVMHLASFRPPDSLNWSGHDSVSLTIWQPSPGDSTWWENGQRWVYDQILVPNPEPFLQFCAYVVDAGGYLVAESPGPPTCPIVFLPRPGPAPAMFAGIPRSRPEGFFSTPSLRGG